MASVTYTAFVENVITNQNGDVFALNTAEPHRRKNDRDEWETTARTFRDVKVSRESGIQLAQFAKGDRIDITGTEKTERTPGAGNAPDRYRLVVWADSITRAGTTPTHGEYTAKGDYTVQNDTPPAYADGPGDPWSTAPIPGDETPW